MKFGSKIRLSVLFNGLLQHARVLPCCFLQLTLPNYKFSQRAGRGVDARSAVVLQLLAFTVHELNHLLILRLCRHHLDIAGSNRSK